MKTIFVLTATLFEMTCWAGDSAPFLLDTIEPLVETGEEVSFSYNSSWVGGDSSAEVVISADGTEIKRTTGEGEFMWSTETAGKHTLTYTTYINGVAQDEVYTATVYADWKYTVEDGNATIVETTQKSGNVTIPPEIDGFPVVGIERDVFSGCTNLFLTAPPSFTNVVSAVKSFEQNEWVRDNSESGEVYKSNDISHNGSTYMTATVKGPCEFSFDWKVSSESGYDKLRWYLDGSQMAEISGEKSWQTVTYSLPEGEHTIKWQYSKDGSVDNGSDCGWVRMNENMAKVDFGDATYIYSDFPCSWGGDANWKNEDDGSLRSGKITHNQSSWMEMKASGEGVLTYKWKASSEYWVDEIFDYGYLSIDGEDMGRRIDDDYSLEGIAIGGQTDWREVKVDIEGDGEHQFRWTFVKDDRDEEDIGEDCIWFKDIKFRPWTNLRFDVCGAEGVVPSMVTELSETNVELPENEMFSNGELVFGGWDCAGVKYKAGAIYKMPHTNVTLTAIWIEKRRVSFDVNGAEGMAPDFVMDIPEAVVKLPLYEGFDRPLYTLTGWSDGENVYAPGGDFEMRSTNVTLTAVYRTNTISMPVISSVDVSNGGRHDKASARISITADAGATVYYTLDGTVPTSKSTRYDGQFTVDMLGLVTVRAIALRDNYFDSPVATFSFTRRQYSAAECLNVGGWQVELSGDAEWFRVLDGAAHDGDAALRSGAIGDSQSTAVEMKVVGKGSLSFWWKSSSEISRGRKRDYVSFQIDGSEYAWLGGSNDWTNVVCNITGTGEHTLKWEYVKNEEALQGEDCAWLDEVVWMPAGAIPELGTGASSEMITLVLSGAADAKLAANIKDAAEYAAFRAWTMGLSGISPEQVKASPNAWLSYVLNTDKLIEGEISDGDLKIETFTLGSEDGVFDMKVRVADASIGPGAALSKLIRAFVVEGTPSLTEDFSVEKVAVAFGEPDGGAATFSISAREIANAFFVRTRLRNQANGDRGNGCEVSFNLNGGGSLPEGMTAKKFVEYASAYGELPTPTREGYKFLGWYTSPEWGELISSDTAMSILTTQTLYARWMEADPLYCVIDLSAGENAASYPVTYLSDVPAGGWTDEYKTTKLVLRRIEPGSFKMNGSYDVTITKAFYCGVFEVTQKQYELVTGSKPSYFTGDELPVEQVSWNMIRGNSDTYNWPTIKTVDPDSFIGRIQARTGLNFDLPTEAQWEYACRAGTTTTYSYGDNANGEYMWNSNGSTSESHEVGTKLSNPWGFYDMHGNVWEWCLDWRGTLSGGLDPEGASSGWERINRGGGSSGGASYCTSAYRNYTGPEQGWLNVGFRLVGNLSE